MTEPATPDRRVLAHARALIERGYKVFPCKRFSKAPATANGFKGASVDPADIIAWFDNDAGYNLAIATGPQPNGKNLLAVDIDPKNGGDITWAALTALYGVPLAPRHETPSGGFHLFFDAGDLDLSISKGKIGQGIDTRGAGGYVLVPHSRLLDENGEIIVYRSTASAALVRNDPTPVTPWIVELLTANPVAESIRRHPSQGHLSDTGPYDRARVGWVFPDELPVDGWTLAGQSGNEQRWTRPGKSVRDGHSATYHTDTGAFVVFTEERPFGGKPTNGGSGASFSPGEYIQHYRLGGDFRALMRQFPSADRSAGGARAVDSASVGGQAQNDVVSDTVALMPDPEWYEQRPWMAACAQMARSVGGSPAAHLLAYMARWATLIPPGYSIPAINGAASSFDLLCVVAGTSGSGKTSAISNARAALPLDRQDLKMELGLGSGEGVIEQYYGMREIEDPDTGRKTKERDKTFVGVNFSISEGLIFADLADRKGTSHVTRFCDAWSGATLSTANARQDTFRHIEAGQYRLTLVMGIQSDMADQLLTDTATSQGFVGRLLFAWTEEPRVRPRPKAPIFPILPVPPDSALPATKDRPKWYQPQFLTYDEAIWVECQDAADARVGTDVPVEDHHHDLLRLKVAGIFALMEGRMSVDLDDWRLATELVERSAAIRRHLRSLCRYVRRDRSHVAAEHRGELKFVEESATERRYIAQMSQRLVDRTPDDGWTVRQAERALTSVSTRHRFEPAKSMAIANGFLVVIDERITKR